MMSMSPCPSHRPPMAPQCPRATSWLLTLMSKVFSSLHPAVPSLLPSHCPLPGTSTLHLLPAHHYSGTARPSLCSSACSALTYGYATHPSRLSSNTASSRLPSLIPSVGYIVGTQQLRAKPTTVLFLLRAPAATASTHIIPFQVQVPLVSLLHSYGYKGLPQISCTFC